MMQATGCGGVPRSEFRAPGSRRPCTLLAGIRVERGTRDDWLALSALHYRSHHAGAVTDIFRMTYRVNVFSVAPINGAGVPRPVLSGRASDVNAVRTAGQDPPWHTGGATLNTYYRAAEEPRPDILVGVIVYSRSPLSLAARDRATGGRYRTGGLGRVAFAALINRELRIISRVVLAPNWRGLGLGSRLVAETIPQVGVPYVETLAAMGEMHPLFVRAGMAAYPQPPSAEGERLRAALEAAGLARADRRSAARLEESLGALDPLRRRLAEREIVRWARSYLGAKNHRTNRPDRRRMLDLVARHLDSAPVYYLWRYEQPVGRDGARNLAANGKESA